MSNINCQTDDEELQAFLLLVVEDRAESGGLSSSDGKDSFGGRDVAVD
jgi:hypothetical protein